MRYFVKNCSFARNLDSCGLVDCIKKTGFRFYSISSILGEKANSSSEKISKILKVAIVGVPNAGKSTLLNQILGRNVFAISRKVHTTRCCARGILNVGNTQLVFLDTPGVVSVKEGLKHHLEHTCIVDSENAIQEADVIGILHDASNEYTKFKLDSKLLRLLYLYPQKHSFLILNKIDKMKTRLDLLDCVRILTNQGKQPNYTIKELENMKFHEISLNEMVSEEDGWSHFQEVFMVSALTGDGIGDIQMYLANLAKPGDWIFPENTITDQKEIRIIENTIFSKFLDVLPFDIAYNLKIELEDFSVGEDGSITTTVNVGTKNSKVMSFVLGKGGKVIRDVAQEVEQSLKQFYLNDVRVKLCAREMKLMRKTTDEDTTESLLKSARSSSGSS